MSNFKSIGPGVVGLRVLKIQGFPIDFDRRPYDSVIRTNVLLCDDPPTVVQESGTYILSKSKPSYSQFYVQIINFLLPWQKEWVGANLNDTMKLADLENPQFVTRIWNVGLSAIQAVL